MDNQNKPSENGEIDLAKYGLGHLEGKNILDLSDADLDKLLKVFGELDFAVRVPIESKPDNVKNLTSQSECRRCGKCCSPDKPDPANPGVEALESELKEIAVHLGIPYEEIEEKTKLGKPVFHPDYMIDLSFTRYLPLPCPWYDADARGCKIYEYRPVVCRMHPVVFGKYGAISIRAACDYGKDVIKAALKQVKQEHPGFEMKL